MFEHVLVQHALSPLLQALVDSIFKIKIRIKINMIAINVLLMENDSDQPSNYLAPIRHFACATRVPHDVVPLALSVLNHPRPFPYLILSFPFHLTRAPGRHRATRQVN